MRRVKSHIEPGIFFRPENPDGLYLQATPLSQYHLLTPEYSFAKCRANPTMNPVNATLAPDDSQSEFTENNITKIIARTIPQTSASMNKFITDIFFPEYLLLRLLKE